MTDIRRKIAQRLRSCRSAEGWTVEETARRLSLISSESISPSRYGNWEQQIRIPKLEQYFELAALFKKSPAYLAGFTDDDGTAPETAMYCVPKPSAIPTEAGVLDVGDDALAFRLTFLEALDLERDKLLPFAATDDSMRPLIHEGDRVLIDRKSTNAEAKDDVFALLIKGRIWLRWIRQDLDGGFTIQAEDRDGYPDQHVTAEKLATLQILGRVKIISHIR